MTGSHSPAASPNRPFILHQQKQSHYLFNFSETKNTFALNKMEATAPSLAYYYNINPTKPLCFSSSQSLTFSNSQFFISSSSSSHSFTSLCFKSSKTKQLRRSIRPVKAASDADNLSSDNTEKWLLEPVGDGDTRHIGFKVPMPDAFEIASSVVTVGRLPEKADMVIPVATVSGVHARIKKKEGSLLVTDLDSTNGTFINEKRLRPGEVATISPGSCITFGDTHLAMFRVSKLENVDLPSKPEESEVKLDADVPMDNLKTTN
ncbi:Forkhead-associated (FHA) domain [Macleaya cordata]|uniref:Forkhead-associated (FHA) domain n=1 Tax=Macleaya cordata TaxID=56857 RepID=A0A200Q0C6_MACCD|nr:Forkhead-associated (FHA) domain [Macleaya cordata]